MAEAAYRLIPGLNLKSSNTKATFVASGFEENRSKFCRKVQEEGDDDFEYNSDGEEIPNSSENGKELLSYINSTKPRENYIKANFRVAPTKVASLRFYRFRPEIEKTPKLYK